MFVPMSANDSVFTHGQMNKVGSQMSHTTQHEREVRLFALSLCFPHNDIDVLIQAHKVYDCLNIPYVNVGLCLSKACRDPSENQMAITILYIFRTPHSG